MEGVIRIRQPDDPGVMLRRRPSRFRRHLRFPSSGKQWRSPTRTSDADSRPPKSRNRPVPDRDSDGFVQVPAYRASVWRGPKCGNGFPYASGRPQMAAEAVRESLSRSWDDRRPSGVRCADSNHRPLHWLISRTIGSRGPILQPLSIDGVPVSCGGGERALQNDPCREYPWLSSASVSPWNGPKIPDS